MDAFIRSCIMEALNKQLEELRRRRILVPFSEGRNMMGVLDETGQLDYGQVFVQYTTEKGQTNVLTGPVTVSKMPALHPGDVRKLTAVNVLSLEHMIDVIVFPQKGQRPHPNEMSGSDLDGDLYTVIWHKDLILSDNEDPMDFPSTKKVEVEGMIQEHHLIEHVKNFIKTNKTGIIARQHLINADKRDQGIFSQECLKLAELHSNAVDAAKTGFIPKIDKNLSIREVPDFLDKADHKQTYPSQRIHGQIYRYVNQLSKKVNNFKRKEHIAGHQGMLLRDDDDSAAASRARALHTAYCSEIDKLRQRFGVNDEYKLWSGENSSGRNTKRNTDSRKQVFDLQKRCGMTLRYTGVSANCSETLWQWKNNAQEIWDNCFRICGQCQKGGCHGLPWLMWDDLHQGQGNEDTQVHSGGEISGEHVNEASRINSLHALNNVMYSIIGGQVLEMVKHENKLGSQTLCCFRRLLCNDVLLVAIQTHFWMAVVLEFILEKVQYICHAAEQDQVSLGICQYSSKVAHLLGLLPGINLEGYLAIARPVSSSWFSISYWFGSNASGPNLSDLEAKYKSVHQNSLNLTDSELEKTGRLVTYTLWEIYSDPSGLGSDHVKEEAIDALMGIAFNRICTPPNKSTGNSFFIANAHADVNVEDVGIRIVGYRKLLRAFNFDKQMCQRLCRDKEASLKAYIEPKIKQKFPCLVYLNTTMQSSSIRFDYRGPKSVVDSLVKYLDHINISA